MKFESSLVGLRRKGCAVFFATIAANLASVSAGEMDSVTIRLDNDMLGGTDSRYTAGTEFDLAYKPWAPADGRSLYWKTLALGQWIFTPERVNEREVVKDGRPYAGWSYLRYGLHRDQGNIASSWQLTLGMVGPSSYAEDVQRAVHDFIDDAMPIGWHNQLLDEFGYGFDYSRHRVFYRWNLDGERSIQFSESKRVSLGNVDSSFAQGFQLRLGKNQREFHVPDRIGSPAGFIFHKSDFAGLARSMQPRRFYWLLGGKATYVGQNIFLDGNSHKRSHWVDKHPFVYEAEAGFAYMRPGFKLSLVMVYRSEEFREQIGGQSFGSLSFTFKR